MPRILAALALLAPVVAMAQVPENEAVRAAAQAFVKAQREKDAAALDQALAPEFLYASATGKIGSKRDFIAGFTMPGTTFTTFDITDPLFLRATADSAVVGGEGRIAGSTGGSPFSEHFRFSHTMARREGRWLIVYTQITPLPR